MKRLLLTVLLLLSLVFVVATQPQALAQTVDQIVIKLRPGAAAPPGAIPVDGLKDVYTLPVGVGVRADEALKRAEASHGVEYAHPDYVIRVDPIVSKAPPDLAILINTNDPFAPQQYSLSRMAVNPAWDITRGDGVTVAIVDSGIDCRHPDILSQCVIGRDFVNNDDDPADDHGHGTHVAGIVGAVGDNNLGIVGVAHRARLMPVKALGAGGSGRHSEIAAGITWATDWGAKVINLSLGAPFGSATLENAINYAWGKGVVVVCAAGNDGSATDHYPAAYKNCISVAATNSADQRAPFSNYAASVDVAAPGVSILSTTRGSYQAWDGTSMAAPNVAGVVALIRAAHPTWSNTQVRAALESTADPIRADRLTVGRVNAFRAVQSTNPQPLPTATPQPALCTSPDPAICLEVAINYYRGVLGEGLLSPYNNRLELRQAADYHNRWMRDHNAFCHECPGEPSLYKRLVSAGYEPRWWSEVIAKQYRTPADAVQGWLSSPGHRAILLDANLKDMGCAVLPGTAGPWYTCDFGVSNILPRPTPTATLTGIPWPGPTSQPFPTRTPTSLPTSAPSVTPAPRKGFIIRIAPNADGRGYAEASRLCGMGYAGVVCEDAP